MRNIWVQWILGLGAAGGLACGASWTEVDAGLPRSPLGVRTVVVDPSSPSIIYALGGSLFKSTDSGGMWNLVGGVSSVSSLVIDPGDSSVLYAIAHGTVVKSLDGGHSWNSTGFGLDSASTLAIDPQDTSTLYAIAGSAIFKTTDGGASWSPKTTGLPTPLLDGHLAIDATNPSTIYLNGHGLYKSTDGGESWRGLVVRPGYCNCPVVLDPAHPSTVYAVFYTADSPGQGGNLFNLYKSTDGGENWSAANAGISGFVTSLVVDPASTIYASYLVGDPTGAVVKSADGGASWSPANTGFPANTPPIFSLALDPANPFTIFAGYFDLYSGRGGVFKTRDGGASWEDASAGLAIIDIHALAIDPLNESTIYAAAGDGVSKSTDGGANWNSVHFPSPSLGTAIVPSLLIDPRNSQVLYASVEASGGCYFMDRFLRKSTDGGATWNDLTINNCVFGATVPLALDPSDSNTLYATPEDPADCGTPLDKTSDGGASWNLGYIDGYVTALVIDPANPATLYSGTAWWPRGILKSTDGGKTWTSTPLTDVDVSALVIDPNNANVLYAGTAAPYPDGAPGLLKTTDGGATWFAINTGLAEVIRTRTPITALVIDPQLSVLYLGTSGSGAFQSTDGGATWTPFNDDLPGLEIRALAVSSGGSGTVYAGTPGGIFRRDKRQ